jgi:ABC-2 type transport system ATP-binding protein
MTRLAVETSELAKTYRALRRTPTPALKGVSIKVESGIIFGLLGQNGAGKTTLLKILLGLIPPSEGRARVLDGDPGDSALRRRIGYLPEVMRLPDYLRAESFLNYMGRLNGVDAATLRRRVPELIEMVGLASHKKKQLREYSKGMQQRIGLAQVLVNDPDLLFLDEPTEGLDPVGRKEVRDLLLSLRKQGKTIFLNAHILSEVELVCDRCVILRKGEVARDGPPAEFTRGTGEMHLRLGALTDPARAAISNTVEVIRWDATGCIFRPRDTAQLNALIDRLRAIPVEIEAVEPVRASLEEYFMGVVRGN